MFQCNNPKCNKPIKVNVVNRKVFHNPSAADVKPLYCYQCHRMNEARRGHTINFKPRQKRVEADQPVKNYRKAV